MASMSEWGMRLFLMWPFVTSDAFVDYIMFMIISFVPSHFKCIFLNRIAIKWNVI